MFFQADNEVLVRSENSNFSTFGSSFASASLALRKAELQCSMKTSVGKEASESISPIGVAQLQRELQSGCIIMSSLKKTLRKMDSSELSEEGRSDTESPVGPVSEPCEPSHGYVNLPTEKASNSDEETQVPPPLAKKERSR